MGRARFLFFMSLILVLLLTSAKIPLARPDIESHNLWCLYAKNRWNIITRKMLGIFNKWIGDLDIVLIMKKRSQVEILRKKNFLSP